MYFNTAHETQLNSPVRKIQAKVELFNESSALVETYNYTDALQSITIERIGDESKFFGFGICQKLNVHLRDPNRAINITTANYLKVHFGFDDDYGDYFPNFYVTETHRDENTNELSITAYDALYNASNHTLSEISFAEPAAEGESGYSLYEFTTFCANLLGFDSVFINFAANKAFQTYYDYGANVDGTENIRDILNAVAEVTQTVYYVRGDGLQFTRLGNELFYGSINKNNYISLDSKTNRRLAAITHVNELGDAVTASLEVSGTTQYIRDNPFWNLRDDIGTLLDEALAAVGGLTINQFDCTWRGNWLLEIGDKLEIVTKDNKKVYGYLFNDTLTYDGGLSQRTTWQYSGDTMETANNPTSLGDALKQTFAKVDKVNREIDLIASETDANSEAIAALEITTDSISSTVSRVEENTNAAIENVNEEIKKLSARIETTAEHVKIEILEELRDGDNVTNVTTNTGFTFNDEGLTVSKSGSEMSTLITEDGMIVSKNGEDVLIADNEGVKAVNLHATTYLIIGENSRFEDFERDGPRTGCFWIGPQ